MKKFAQTSLVDYLIDLLPQIGKKFNISPDGVQNKDAKVLFDMWKDSKNNANGKVINKPKNVPQDNINNLQSSGLIRVVGDKIQITAKGSEVLKTMILGDDRSAFDKGTEVDYVTASQNIKTPSKIKKQSKIYNDQWWDNALK